MKTPKTFRALVFLGILFLLVRCSSSSSTVAENNSSKKIIFSPFVGQSMQQASFQSILSSEEHFQKTELLNTIGTDFQDSWNYSMDQPVPNPEFAFDCWMRIDSPATDDYPIQQGESNVLYNNQENLGGYEAALVAKKSGTSDRYRVMFSTKWQEILVWSSKGGILAVTPYPFNVGQTYRVLFAVRGAQLQVYVNHQKILDFYNTTAPIAPDTLGVATKEGSTYFGPLRVWGLGNPLPPPVHQPKFSIRTWKGVKWGFDNDEPIFALPGKNAFATEVKLVPGYEAQLALPWYMQNWVDEPFRTDQIDSISPPTKTGDQLEFTLTTKDKLWRKDLINHTKITVSYLPDKNVYQYDHESELIIPTGATLNVNAAIDISDPLFNKITPSASTQGRQWPITHQWSVYQNIDGNYYKEPLNHFSWYPGYGTPEWWNALMYYMKPDNGSWVVIGDPIANPVLQWLESSTRKEFSALMCWWGYDLHFNWFPGDGSPTTLSAGSYKVNWRLTSLPGAEANNLLATAGYAFPGDLTSKWLVYTGGVGYVEKFDKTVLKASPFGEFVWGESTFQDATVGKDDTTSLRLDGPDFVQTTAGGSQMTEDFEPDTDYEISAWVKTENIQGEGPGIVFSGHPYYPGITGTHDWQQIGFVARPEEPIHTVAFSLHLSGSGQAWIDNFLIRPITASHPVTPGLNNLPKPLTSVGTPSTTKLLEWKTANSVGDLAKTVLDSSGHGNHAVRQNVTIGTADGNNVFHFPGTSNSQMLMRGHESVHIPSPATLILWFKPGIGQNGWNVVISGGPRDYDYWRFLISKTDQYTPYFQSGYGTIGNGTKIVDENQWSQLVLVDSGTQISVYLNGQLFGTQNSSAPLFGSETKGYLRLGAMSYSGKAEANYEGEISQVKILNRALTAAEVLTEFGKGAFAP